MSISRRTLLATGALAPAAAVLTPTLAAADGHASGPQNAIQHTVQLGEMQVATMLAGTRVVEEPQNIFGMNASAEDFAAASAANFIPADKTRFYFTPTVVKTGAEVVLFDTGLSAGGTLPALAAAGYAPEDVTIVVITHMHGDHIGGLMNEGAPTYPNARYVTGQVEFDAWAGRENERFEANMRPLAEKTSFIGDGGSVASGITAMAAFGHTPGHMTYMLESGGQQLLLIADLTNHYVWSLAYPDWEVRFDQDKAAAAASRRKVLGMLAADKVPMVGYHMPFPGMGYVEANGDGFRYVPVSYQLSLA
ncbi:Metallo-beta-lactamase family protein [Candidatus Rhodobacter oscarellae]|uniref:Metallo-beta-lactamase family protein n=1 Tax=Candidatus Rhodobacter oscarellae TaxID=1675527 RepID=A0A0J9EA21_9RHOB|nr:MBL fold metallo-hydrolase [Candidatus Rhodobacter lobularis]KMW58524.1 Metallo-beta-lactamase family protein [Candidatus Rhodobacter lobularis]